MAKKKANLGPSPFKQEFVTMAKKKADLKRRIEGETLDQYSLRMQAELFVEKMPHRFLWDVDNDEMVEQLLEFVKEVDESRAEAQRCPKKIS